MRGRLKWPGRCDECEGALTVYLSGGHTWSYHKCPPAKESTGHTHASGMACRCSGVTGEGDSDYSDPVSKASISGQTIRDLREGDSS